MKVKCIYHDVVQDKYDATVFYEPNGLYDVTKERATELIASKYFELVEVVKDDAADEETKKVNKKSVKKSAK